jgi:GNAT superfamily N-acetyltransferase
MRFWEFVVEEHQPKPATFADGTLRLSQHLQNRSVQREIPMANIIKVLQRLEALRGKDLQQLPPTTFIVKTPEGFELAMAKTQNLDTKKIEYVVATVRQRLKPGAGQRIIYLEDQVNEISRLPKTEVGDWGDKGTLADPEHPIKTKPLPGGSKFSYAVNKTGQGDIEIMIFDGQTLAAEMDLFDTQDFMKTWRVETVVVDPDYRGQGLGKALYGIALSILKLTVEAGESQTRHGQQMWLMLNSIPGVEVVGYNMEPNDKYQPKPGDKIVDQNKTWTRYTFPVRPGSSSMRSGRPGTGIYTSQASMIARWTGQ